MAGHGSLSRSLIRWLKVHERERGRERNRKWGIREGDTKENAPAFTPMILWLKAYSCEANGKNQESYNFLAGKWTDNGGDFY